MKKFIIIFVLLSTLISIFSAIGNFNARQERNDWSISSQREFDNSQVTRNNSEFQSEQDAYFEKQYGMPYSTYLPTVSCLSAINNDYTSLAQLPQCEEYLTENLVDSKGRLSSTANEMLNARQADYTYVVTLENKYTPSTPTVTRVSEVTQSYIKTFLGTFINPTILASLLVFAYFSLQLLSSIRNNNLDINSDLLLYLNFVVIPIIFSSTALIDSVYCTSGCFVPIFTMTAAPVLSIIFLIYSVIKYYKTAIILVTKKLVIRHLLLFLIMLVIFSVFTVPELLDAIL